MAPPRGKFMVEAATNNGPMKRKDHYDLRFRFYSIDRNGEVMVRTVTGRAVSRRKQIRKTAWEKRLKMEILRGKISVE